MSGLCVFVVVLFINGFVIKKYSFQSLGEQYELQNVAAECRVCVVSVNLLFGGDRPHLSLRALPSCLCPPLGHCCLSLSSWKSESCAALSAPARCCRASCAIGWLAAGFAVIGSAAGRPASPGIPLGWGLRRS